MMQIYWKKFYLLIFQASQPRRRMEDGYNFSRQSNIGLWRSLRDNDFEEQDIWAVLNESKDSSLKSNGSSSSSITHESNGVKQQSSAPVNIPDHWSNLSTKMMSGSWHHDDGGFHGYDDDDDDEDEDGYKFKLPPHEILARRLARSQISPFSVFEGVGRKLKGRDLRKVRNAVLTKTGFLE